MILIFGATTVDFWCEKVTFILVLVRICYFIWCENVIFAFQKCGAKKLTFGAKSRARHLKNSGEMRIGPNDMKVYRVLEVLAKPNLT